MCYLCKKQDGGLKYILAQNVEIVDASNIDWEQVRIQAAMTAMQGLLACKYFDPYRDDIASIAVTYADSLLYKLKNSKE